MQLGDYLIRRIFYAISTLIVVVIFNFFLFRVLPGDPVKMLVHSPRMTKEAQKQITKDFGLDKPIWINLEHLKNKDYAGAFDTQFIAYVRNLLNMNMGISFVNRRPVTELLVERVWRTVILLIGGEVIAIIIGISLGLLAAWRRGTKLDTGLLLFALFSWAMPTFFFGIILLILVGGYLPLGGMVTPGLGSDNRLDYWIDVGKHLILPTLTMAIVYSGGYIMIMRSSLVEVLAEDYILTAKAKGLNTFGVLREHALKNAMLPMVTLIALSLGFIIGGAIQVETVFSWPGVGRLMFDAVQARDYPVLQGTFLLLAIAIIAANLLADLTYLVLDPRVRVK
jgi:peptide/nickel transport system permease protein